MIWLEVSQIIDRLSAGANATIFFKGAKPATAE
jgi:hypothetical protein